MLTERRRFPPYGLAGGDPGATGRNLLIPSAAPEHNRLARVSPPAGRPTAHDPGQPMQQELPGKVTVQARRGDVIRLETPGGGGHGRA
jgi:N-methylhydantoinase B/oxoprolinase/acetone carboxylase alpha subunit